MAWQEIYGDDLLQRRLKTIQVCMHCGAECGKGNKFCEFCTTKPLREEMDEENKKIFESAGLVYRCKFCEI